MTSPLVEYDMVHLACVVYHPIFGTDQPGSAQRWCSQAVTRQGSQMALVRLATDSPKQSQLDGMGHEWNHSRIPTE